MIEALGDWATSAELRRTPTLAERLAGYQCGAAEIKLFNEVARQGIMSATEVANAVLGAGLTIDGGDPYQLLDAILRLHRITEDTTYTIGTGSQYETINDALEDLSAKSIPVGVTVRLQLLSQEYSLSTGTDSIRASHPFGHRIILSGVTPTGGGFPNAAAVNNANPATVEDTLRGRFPTQIECAGITGLFLNNGALQLVENILFIGDGTGPDTTCGVLVGESKTAEAGRGSVHMHDVWCHQFAGSGFRSRYSSGITGYRLGATHCIREGFHSSNNATIATTSQLIAVRNVGPGVYASDAGLVETQINSEIKANGGAGGFSIDYGSNARIKDTTISDHATSGQCGVRASSGSQVTIIDSAFSNNATGVRAQMGAFIQVSGLTGSPTLSPAANTVGNGNAYINQ